MTDDLEEIHCARSLKEDYALRARTTYHSQEERLGYLRLASAQAEIELELIRQRGAEKA